MQTYESQKDTGRGVKSINVAIDEPSTVCAHHWKIESPSGTWSLGICNKCGEYDAFKNSLDESSWTGAASHIATTKNNKRIKDVTKIEFLQSCIPPRKSRDGSYTEAFKTRMVSLAADGKRSYVRKKFNIPETTLRGWIKNS